MDVESPGAAIALTTYRALLIDATERIGGSRGRMAMGQALAGLGAVSAFAYRSQGTTVRAAEDGAPPWFDGPDDRDRRLRGAVERACAILRARCGNDERRWTLGSVQRVDLRHPLGDVPGLGRLFSIGARGFGGDGNTVVQGGAVPWNEVGHVTVAPGYRQVIDLADWDRSLFMLPTGNSGIPGHPRYDDCTAEYLAGRYRPLLFSRAAVDRAAQEAALRGGATRHRAPRRTRGGSCVGGGGDRARPQLLVAA
jgi:penicillin amidase